MDALRIKLDDGTRKKSPLQSAFDIMEIVRLTVVRSVEHMNKLNARTTTIGRSSLESKHFSFRISGEGAWLPTTCKRQCFSVIVICRSLARETNFLAFWHYSLHAIKVMHDGIKNERNEQRDEKKNCERMWSELYCIVSWVDGWWTESEWGVQQAGSWNTC